MFKKLNYPLAPFVVALVLGDMTEEALRQSLIMSGGSLLIFFTRPIAVTGIVVAAVLFCLPMLAPMVRRARARGSAPGGSAS